MPIEVLGDLQGPKFRNGELADGPVTLTAGETIEIGLMKDESDTTKTGRVTMAPSVEQTALMKGLAPGMRLLFDDGLMEVKCSEKISDTEAKIEVIFGGTLKAKKGINAPDLEIDCAALTAKDVEDAERVRRAEPPLMNRGDAAAATWIFRGDD